MSENQAKRTDMTEPPERSPLWGLTLILGEIAQRVQRDSNSDGPGNTPRAAETEQQSGSDS
jgi:hypothetical protein